MHAWKTFEQESEVGHGRRGTTPDDPCGHPRLAEGPCGQGGPGQQATGTVPGEKKLRMVKKRAEIVKVSKVKQRQGI